MLNRIDKLQQGRDYYYNNKKRLQEYKKQYYEQEKIKIKESNRVYRENNKEKIIKIRKKYYEKNKEKINEKSKIFRQNNREKIRNQRRKKLGFKQFWKRIERPIIKKQKQKEYTKRYYLKNKDEINKRKKINGKIYKPKDPDYFKKYYKNNKKHIIQLTRNWNKNNPEKRRKYGNDRYVREKNIIGDYSISEWINLKIIMNNHCLNCWKTDTKLTIDHIIPITKGGTNYIDNIQPLCKSCNSSKNNKYDEINLLYLAI